MRTNESPADLQVEGRPKTRVAYSNFDVHTALQKEDMEAKWNCYDFSIYTKDECIFIFAHELDKYAVECLLSGNETLAMDAIKNIFRNRLESATALGSFVHNNEYYDKTLIAMAEHGFREEYSKRIAVFAGSLYLKRHNEVHEMLEIVNKVLGL